MTYLRLKGVVLSMLFFTSAAPLLGTVRSASTPVSGGGTLNYSVTSSPQTANCQEGSYRYTNFTYSGFSYVDSSGAASGTSDSIVVNTVGEEPVPEGCFPPPPSNFPFQYSLSLPNSAGLLFEIDNPGSNGSAALGTLIDPQYKVLSILYATPGNFSSDGFTNSTTNGTVTTIENDFTQGTSVTNGGGTPFISASLTLGTSTTSGNSAAFTEQISEATSISNASNSSGPNTVNHSQDLFLIWLNPEISALPVNADGSGGYTYSVQTPYQNGSIQPASIIEVTAETMQSQNGVTNIPLSILQRQYDAKTGQYDLPGLASICADQSQYVYNCSSGGQCGCVPGDFAGVLAIDPLVNTNTATSPMAFDTSGAAACMAPTTSNSCRYVPVLSSNGGGIQQYQPLSGPQCSGCNRPSNGYTQTDSTSTTETLIESATESISFSVKIGPPIFNSTHTTTMSWTDRESTGTINGTSNQMQYNLSSGTVGCYQDVLVYEDTVFHTFVTQQAPGNNSCP